MYLETTLAQLGGGILDGCSKMHVGLFMIPTQGIVVFSLDCNYIGGPNSET